MGDLDPLAARFALADDEQARAHQLLHHRRAALAEHVVELRAGEDGAGALGGDRVAEDLAHQALLVRAHRLERRLGVLRERAAHTAERPVGLVADLVEAAVAQLPQLAGGEREERQGAGGAGHRLDHLVRQPRVVELVAGAAERLDQDALEVGGRRRGQELERRAESGAEGLHRLGA